MKLKLINYHTLSLVTSKGLFKVYIKSIQRKIFRKSEKNYVNLSKSAWKCTTVVINDFSSASPLNFLKKMLIKLCHLHNLENLILIDLEIAKYDFRI